MSIGDGHPCYDSAPSTVCDGFKILSISPKIRDGKVGERRVAVIQSVATLLRPSGPLKNKMKFKTAKAHGIALLHN
jgi:hypothetical protein